jgi:hypothetical protein
MRDVERQFDSWQFRLVLDVPFFCGCVRFFCFSHCINDVINANGWLQQYESEYRYEIIRQTLKRRDENEMAITMATATETAATAHFFSSVVLNSPAVR